MVNYKLLCMIFQLILLSGCSMTNSSQSEGFVIGLIVVGPLFIAIGIKSGSDNGFDTGTAFVYLAMGASILLYG